jgi:hypothetical protein
LNLIVSWPKAAIFNNAWRPIPSGEETFNVYPMGSVQPKPDPNSPITYGYERGTTSAQTYQQSAGGSPAARLNSEIRGSYMQLPRASGSRPDDSDLKGPVLKVQMSFTATLTSDGYEFAFSPKTEDARFMTVAIASAQNRRLIEAYTRAGVKTEQTKLPIANIVPIEIAAREFVIVPAVGEVREQKAVVRRPGSTMTSGSGFAVEHATVVLLDKDREPVLFGRVSLFQ